MNASKSKRRIRRRPIPDAPSKRGLLLLSSYRPDEMTLTSTPITAVTRKLRVRWAVDDPEFPPTETHTN